MLENVVIDNGSKKLKAVYESRLIKILQRKQSRRVLKALQDKAKKIEELEQRKKDKLITKEEYKNERKTIKLQIPRNFKKTQKKIAKKYKKALNQRKDLYHKISKTLTDKFELIAVEDLRVKNMSKSAKGNEINHGKNVKAKAGLNKTILNASFYQFQSMLEYKSKLNGKLFVKVDPKYSSLECSVCGDKLNRPKQDKFKCTKCGYEANPIFKHQKLS